MVKADEVEAMLRLHKLGWGTKRIVREFGRSRNTVKRYVEARGWVSYGGAGRAAKLAGLDSWLEKRFLQHRGNAEVVRQDLGRELSIEVGLRTVERAVAPYRRLLAADPPGVTPATCGKPRSDRSSVRIGGTREDVIDRWMWDRRQEKGREIAAAWSGHVVHARHD